MKKRIMIVMLAVMAIAFAGNSRGWEPVKAERSDIRLVVRDNDIEIKNAPGIIQVHTRTPVQIKIFTILGRLVSSDTLPQGTMQFAVPAHGVYIVKAGDITCKVAV